MVRKFKKLSVLRNEIMGFDLMNTRKPAAFAAGFRAVRASDYKNYVVIAILCKKWYENDTILCKKDKLKARFLCSFA